MPEQSQNRVQKWPETNSVIAHLARLSTGIRDVERAPIQAASSLYINPKKVLATIHERRELDG